MENGASVGGDAGGGVEGGVGEERSKNADVGVGGGADDGVAAGCFGGKVLFVRCGQFVGTC